VLHRLRYLGFGALALGTLTSCAAAATSSNSSLPTLVPSTTAFATMPPVTAPPTTLPGETTTLAPGTPTDYTVQSGDYLYKIAKDHGVSAQDIVTINGWDSVDHPLVPGDSIKVPAPVAGASTVAPTGGGATDTTPTATTAAPSGGDTSVTTTKAPSGSASSTTAAPATGGTPYTVKNGDTVYGIANKNGITPQELVAANGWDSVNHNLYPGDKIVIPAKAG
jgi:LysM repeat protein